MNCKSLFRLSLIQLIGSILLAFGLPGVVLVEAAASGSDGDDPCQRVLVIYGRVSKFQVPAQKDRLFNGVLAETSQSALLLGVSPILGGHEGVRRRIEKSFGPIQKYRWFGELETFNPTETRTIPVIRAINETAGLYVALTNSSKSSVMIENSAEALYRALKKYQPQLLADEVNRLKYDPKNRHLDLRQNAIANEMSSNWRHSARGQLNLIGLLLELAKQDNEQYFTLPSDAFLNLRSVKTYLEIMKDMGGLSSRFARLLNLTNELLETGQLSRAQYLEMAPLLKNLAVRLNYYERQAVVLLLNGTVRPSSPK